MPDFRQPQPKPERLIAEVPNRHARRIALDRGEPAGERFETKVDGITSKRT